MALSPDEARRYARHIVLKDVGGAGQQRLKAARVLIVGAGGLGSPALAYLAAAGVGTISVVDDDEIALSNLQRQIIHKGADAGASKAQSAKRFAEALNDFVVVNAHDERLTAANADRLMEGASVVLDGSDTLETRRTVAHATEKARIPLVSGAVSMFDGQVTLIAPHLKDRDGNPAPRFHDLYSDQAEANALPSCEEVGVLGPVTGVIGTLMAMEAMKLILKTGDLLLGRLLIYDGRGARFTELRYSRSRDERASR